MTLIRVLHDGNEVYIRALEQIGGAPDSVTFDKKVSHPCKISKELDQHVKHRTSRSLEDMIEQDHRGIKKRYGPRAGFYSSAGPKISVLLLMGLDLFTRWQTG